MLANTPLSEGGGVIGILIHGLLFQCTVRLCHVGKTLQQKEMHRDQHSWRFGLVAL